VPSSRLFACLVTNVGVCVTGRALQGSRRGHDPSAGKCHKKAGQGCDDNPKVEQEDRSQCAQHDVPGVNTDYFFRGSADMDIGVCIHRNCSKHCCSLLISHAVVLLLSCRIPLFFGVQKWRLHLEHNDEAHKQPFLLQPVWDFLLHYAYD